MSRRPRRGGAGYGEERGTGGAGFGEVRSSGGAVGGDGEGTAERPAGRGGHRPGAVAAGLLVAASLAALLTGCGKAGGGNGSAGARLPTADTLAEADQQLHAYLQDVMPIGGRDTGTRSGSLFPGSRMAPITCRDRGQASHVVAETVSGTRDGYASKVVVLLRHRGWHISGWNDDTPDGSRVTGEIQAGYWISVQQDDDVLTVAIQTPCLRGEPLPERSDFPAERTEPRGV